MGRSHDHSASVRIWRMDKSDIATEYPFVCQSVIHTGHRQNIFNAQMLPRSSRMYGFVSVLYIRNTKSYLLELLELVFQAINKFEFLTSTGLGLAL